MRDGRAEGLPAIRDGGHAAISFMPDTKEGMFASLKFTTRRFMCIVTPKPIGLTT